MVLPKKNDEASVKETKEKKRPLHTSREYESELKKLRKRICSMAERVEVMIGRSVKALEDHDSALAQEVIDSDEAVDRDEVETDELCLVILAKRQPMASDLRFITLALKMVTDLERIGDLAGNICETVKRLAATAPLKPYVDLPRMGELVCKMLHDAIVAFINRDEGVARQVITEDDEVDELHKMVSHDLLKMMLKSETYVERAMHVLGIAKLLERVGDHCTNLAEQVIFMVRGKDIRHKD